MSSLACPECRKEMIVQKDYKPVECSQCGRTVYIPGEKFHKIVCTDCKDTHSGTDTDKQPSGLI